MATTIIEDKKLKPKDFSSSQDVKWCPGCGDYSILKQVQSVLAELGKTTENTVFVSGIGCSSRFPYYMNTYGIHSIHGRAPAFASGIKATNPNLSTWIISGDGDAMSIGGNHFIHLLRRNFDVNFLLFNNEIYGLTKGQYSPTSPQGKVTKSSPMGSLDHPFNPLALSMGADATFVARSMDRDPKHLREILKRADAHTGTSFVEIYQNCNVFNDGAFFTFSEKDTKLDTVLHLENGSPLVFGTADSKGIRLDGFKPQIVDLTSGKYTKNDLWIHDELDRNKANLLTRFFDDPKKEGAFPRPFGVFYTEKRTTYEVALKEQIKHAITTQSAGVLDDLLRGNNTWEVE